MFNRLTEKISEFQPRGITLSHIRSVSEPLHLGRLQGNHFDLVVRDLKPHGNRCHGDLEKLVDEAVENTKVRVMNRGNAVDPKKTASGMVDLALHIE